MTDLFDSKSELAQFATSLVSRPWFRRLWVVQEVALASDLELWCGKVSISGQLFFAGIRLLCSAVYDPPSPLFVGPYRYAHKLGILRSQVLAGECRSLAYLAQRLSEWDCEKSQDKRNALFGVASRNNPTTSWFTPTYTVTGPDLYIDFAIKHIRATGGLQILHFAGCGDNAVFVESMVGTNWQLDLRPPSNDVPSWIPDWRIRSRPLEMLGTNESYSSIGFSATESHPEFDIDYFPRTLTVRAMLLDKIKLCGIPYYPSLCGRIGISEHSLFRSWFQLAKQQLEEANLEAMFAQTLVMEGKVAAIEHDKIRIRPAEVMSFFKHWATKYLSEAESDARQESNHGIDYSTQFGYLAAEICRNRTFFITESGKLGVGSIHASPGAHIFAIHGLKTPFLVHLQPWQHVLRGECYVHGFMDDKAQHSELDISLRLG